MISTMKDYMSNKLYYINYDLGLSFSYFDTGFSLRNHRNLKLCDTSPILVIGMQTSVKFIIGRRHNFGIYI